MTIFRISPLSDISVVYTLFHAFNILFHEETHYGVCSPTQPGIKGVKTLKILLWCGHPPYCIKHLLGIYFACPFCMFLFLHTFIRCIVLCIFIQSRDNHFIGFVYLVLNLKPVLRCKIPITEFLAQSSLYKYCSKK